MFFDEILELPVELACLVGVKNSRCPLNQLCANGPGNFVPTGNSRRAETPNDMFFVFKIDRASGCRHPSIAPTTEIGTMKFVTQRECLSKSIERVGSAIEVSVTGVCWLQRAQQLQHLPRGFARRGRGGVRSRSASCRARRKRNIDWFARASRVVGLSDLGRFIEIGRHVGRIGLAAVGLNPISRVVPGLVNGSIPTRVREKPNLRVLDVSAENIGRLPPPACMMGRMPRPSAMRS
jgi:hypothetical protein